MKKPQTISSRNFISFLMLMFFSYSTFAQVDLTIEAEDATATGTTEIKYNDNASNGSFIKSFSNTPTGALTFEVNGVVTAGVYKLEIFHFNDNAEQNIEISINGGVNSTATLQESNWAFQGLAKSTYIDIALKSGNNTVTILTSYEDVFFDKFNITDNFKVYYVSSSVGLDTNNGKVNTPWRTIEKATEVAEKLSNGGLLVPGDKLLFKSGDTFYGHFNIKCSGTVEKPIEISSYGPGEKPIFSGSGGTITGGDWFEAIVLTNTSNLLATNLWVKNDRQDGSRYSYGEYSSFGIKVKANKWGGISSNLTFRDLKISDVFGITIPPPSEFNSLNATGIRFDADANEAAIEVAIKDVLIEDCYFTHIAKAGVWAVHKGALDFNDDTVNRNQNIIVRNNTFFETGGSGVILSKTYNALVENNDFDNTGHSDTSEPRLAGRGSGMWVWSCRNIIAQYNRSYGVEGPNDSYGMHIDFGNKDIIFQYNYSEESEGGFCEILGDNINSIYRFNVSVNDGYRSSHGSTLWVSDYAGTGNRISSDNNYIYNNTIYLDQNYMPDISIKGKNTYVYNNIFMVTNGEIGENVTILVDAGSKLYVSNNLFQGKINSSFSNLDANSQSGDPLFLAPGISKNKAGYVLQIGSPAIDNGKSFPEPSFPMAGTGIFKNVSIYPIIDAFGETVNINIAVPNIGASNSYNSENTLRNSEINNAQNLFRLYPNPVKDLIQLSLTNDQLSIDLEVFDIQGKSIYTTSIKTVARRASIQLPNSIKNGIYFIKINDGITIEAKQFILYR